MCYVETLAKRTLVFFVATKACQSARAVAAICGRAVQTYTNEQHKRILRFGTHKQRALANKKKLRCVCVCSVFAVIQSKK